MKNQILKWTAGSILLLGFALLFAQCESNDNELAQLEYLKKTTTTNAYDANGITGVTSNQTCDCLMNEFEMEALSASETSALLFMREEEKLARDVYLNMHEKWSAKVFANISNSEQRHMDAILCLLNKYDLEDPVGDNEIGVFQNTGLQALYDNLMETGNQSLNAALRVGATIEDLDIADLMTNLEGVDNEDIKAVFNELLKGSRNHLRAYHNNLTGLDENYVPAYISPELFDEIISSPKQKGGSICGTCLGTGNGPGNGSGNCTGTGNGPGNGSGNCTRTGNGPGNGSGNCTGTGNGPGNGSGTCNGTGPNGKRGM